jgi:hypothetical protein
MSAFEVQSSESLHVLNRVTWGARPRDLERIAAIGIGAFIDQQLQPESIPDPFIDSYIAARRIFAMNVRELDQGDYSTTLNTMLGARLMRAVYSERQLFERMVEFWTDHFNIPIGDLLSYKIVDDRAEPRIVFADQPNIQLFMRPQPDVYLIVRRPFWVELPFDVTWFAEPGASAQMRITGYTRLDTGQGWNVWDTDQSLITTAQTPDSQQSSVGITFYYEHPQIVQVRVEVSATIYPESADPITAIDFNEFTLYVTDDPGEIPSNSDGLAQIVGSSEPLLFDWRLWSGGACAHDLTEACEAFEAGDFGTAAEALVQASAQTEDDAYLRAALMADAGMIAACVNDYANAATAFEYAVSSFALSGAAWHTSAALHNLAIAQIILEDPSGYETYSRLAEMRAQFWDEVGANLIQANTRRTHWEEWRLWEALAFFESINAPQQSTIRAWLDEF